MLNQFHVSEETLQEITNLYAKSGNWEALSSISTQSPTLRDNVILPAIKLEYSLKANFLQERITDFQAKYSRLLLVQENKKLMPMMFGQSGLLSDSDASSDISDTSYNSSKKSSSQYSSSSKTSSSSKRSKTPKNLLQRKVKEGSVLEEDYLVGNLNLMKYTPKIKEEYEDFIQYLVFFGLYEQMEKLVDLLEKYANVTNVKVKNLKQIQFEAANPEMNITYPDIPDFQEVKPITPQEFSRYAYIKLAKK